VPFLVVGVVVVVVLGGGADGKIRYKGINFQIEANNLY
jgi:hypothetical protein